MTGDNAPPPGGVAPLRVIGLEPACTLGSQTIYLLTVSSPLDSSTIHLLILPVVRLSTY